MAKSLLSLCSVQKITTRDGGVGPLGRVWLPFFGWFFANGLQIRDTNTFANVGQDQSVNMLAPVKPNVFNKTCCGGCGDSSGL